MTGHKINALLALHSEGRFLVGHERMKLLEKVAELGSIAKAAKATGFSYKTAWDSVNAVNNLLPTPAFLTRPGGRSGGGAEVTEEGRKLIATFHRLEEKLSLISNIIAEEGMEGQEEAFLWALGVRISARNVFQTEVGADQALARRCRSHAEIRRRAEDFRHRHQRSGRRSRPEAGPHGSGSGQILLHPAVFARTCPKDDRNCFLGVVSDRTDAERNSEIRIDIGFGKTLHAVAPRQTVEDLGLEAGAKVVATFDPSQVILAVN